MISILVSTIWASPISSAIFRTSKDWWWSVLSVGFKWFLIFLLFGLDYGIYKSLNSARQKI